MTKFCYKNNLHIFVSPNFQNMFDIFKKPTKQDEINSYVDGISNSLLSHGFTSKEILEVHEKITTNLISYMENRKGKLLAESKAKNSDYKEASFVLTNLRRVLDSMQELKNM